MRPGDTAASLAGKRIIFVLAGEVLGGAERGALDLARTLTRAMGAEVEVLALDDRPGRARAVAEAERIRWRTLPIPWTGSRSGRVLSLARLALTLRRLRPAVVVSHTNLPNVTCALIWRTTGAKLVVWNQWDVLGTRRFSAYLFRRALQAVPLVVTEAFHARNWLVTEWGVDPDRVHVIRGDIDLQPPVESRAAWRHRLGLEDGDFAACMLAHFHVGKDHATLLRAWRKVVDTLQEDGLKPVLLLGGRPAGTENAVKALAFDLDLSRYVRFLGDVNDVTGLLGAADIAVFSSRSECFPRAVLEPMAAGLAVAGTNIPGIREALGEPGSSLLAAPGDSVGLSEAIVQLARDRPFRLRVGEENAREIEGRRSDASAATTYALLLERALASRRQDARAVDSVPGSS